MERVDFSPYSAYTYKQMQFCVLPINPGITEMERKTGADFDLSRNVAGLSHVLLAVAAFSAVIFFGPVMAL